MIEKKKVVNKINEKAGHGAIKDGLASIVESSPDLIPLFLDGTLGAVVPGVGNFILSMKQKKADRKMNAFFIKMNERIYELEKAVKGYSEERYFEMRDKYFPIITEYVINELQDEKIEYIINGYITLASYEDIQEDLVLTNYDILNELRIADIAVLKYHYDFFNVNSEEFQKDIGLSHEQFIIISDKLVRMGLLDTEYNKKIDSLYDRVNDIVEYIQNQENKRMTGVTASFRYPMKFIMSGSYRETKYGSEFMDFFKMVKQEDSEE
jgi:hypothetical protein